MTRAQKILRTLKRLASSARTADDGAFWIGDSLVEPRLNQITSGGQAQQVERQVMRVLLFLAKHPDQPLSREAIIESIWSKTTPNDEGLTQAVCKLRKVLGDRPGDGRIIQTIRKVGYRLVAPVRPVRSPSLSMPFSFTIRRRSKTVGRSVRIRVEGDFIMAAALLSVTFFFISQIV